jgi:hypothetical protein
MLASAKSPRAWKTSGLSLIPTYPPYGMSQYVYLNTSEHGRGSIYSG